MSCQLHLCSRCQQQTTCVYFTRPRIICFDCVDVPTKEEVLQRLRDFESGFMMVSGYFNPHKPFYRHSHVR